MRKAENLFSAAWKEYSIIFTIFSFFVLIKVKKSIRDIDVF